jgi:DNA-binding transcriptional MocR family regulator
MTNYKLIADALAADISAGRLRPGDRLPPQRAFAYKRRIAASTASRVYAELARRGLTTGEVGRGTFVRMGPPPVNALAPDPMPDAADLELNFSVLPEQLDEMMSCFASLQRHDALVHAMRPIPVAATQGARERTARLLKSGGWSPDQDNILFAGNARQALAASMAALASAGDRLGVEAMTYPLVKGIATRLGISLVPIAMDHDGLRPDALVQAHRATPLKGIYLKPTMQNPLGITMSPGRRADVVTALQDCGLYAIEDGVYSFLFDEPPLAALDPSRTILVDSLTKFVALGVIVSPPKLRQAIGSAIRSGAWGTYGLAFAIASHFMRDETAGRLAKARRKDAAKRQAIAREVLDGMRVRGDPRAYHLWLELPDSWRADAYVAAAARARIAITPASAFAVGGGHAPNAVRIALASPPLDVLAQALRTLRHLAESGSDELAME